MEDARSLRIARERFVCEVRSALGNVPPEVVTSAVGHAVLAEALVQIAADILDSQENSTFMGWLLDSSARRGPLPGVQSSAV